MKLLLDRIFKGDEYTIGKLYIDNDYFCDTIEDKDRGLRQDMSLDDIKQIKVMHETAIPTGEYEIVMNVKSPKYKRILPRLLNVPGFEGILIHAGNYAKDSSGCILPGKNTSKGMVSSSKVWEQKLIDKLNEATDKIQITIQ